MKKSSKSFNISALILVLVGFMFASTSIGFADEKKAEDTVTTTDAAKDTDGKKKKKKKGDDEEEPECE